jgi:glycosyltransferase involved in cell wall biosynthesis
VLAEILRLYPKADLFALVDFLPDADRKALLGKRATTSFIQNIPFAESSFRLWLPLFPRAIESLDLSSYELVISSSHAVAKGVMTHRGQVHICYCFTPMRYAWDLREQYLRRMGFDRGLRGMLVRPVLSRLRAWDRAASARVDYFIAISRHIADRIRRCYDRESTVIYPPVAVAPTADFGPRGDHYVTVSQLVPYKRIDLIVQAFANLPEHRLVIVGDGPERRRIEATATPNVRFLGWLPEHERAGGSHPRAFIFRMTSVAPPGPSARHARHRAAGGASSETIVGMDSDTPRAFCTASRPPRHRRALAIQAHAFAIRPEACRENAHRFDVDRFRRDLLAFVDARVPNATLTGPSP